MFQKSLLKNFVKSYNAPDIKDIIKLITKDKLIAEDANGAEFISLLSKTLNWTNCIREVKNNTDMKKADGVVYDKDDNPIAIVELKSSDKKISNRDIIAQAFGYKIEKPTCKYVIISNFKQLDIYSESSDVCFSLDMTLSENYTTLYALLNQSSLETNEIARLKRLSKSQEQITKEVYKEYSSFRLSLLNNLIEKNKELSKEDIFKCANKLLDRFMFILFAEDRNLIPANSIGTIIKQYENSKDGWDEVKPLYYYYKKYFHFIDIGNPDITPNIPKYNGNLFKPDEQLESLIIDDHIIKEPLASLSKRDFSDDVDVEVLGHIFEQSLNDLEKIKESLFEEHKIVNTRKKDGVFYTPKFITEYIINNTVSKLCDDKKEDLKLYEDMKDTKKSKEKRRDTLHTYREYLESLKIVDPACGSGAFLTACFRYLLDEHKWIQKELGKAEAGLFDYHDIDKQIIEKNLFGVDINGASVGIAKLSLWLQTAKRDRPLSNLMDNIKSANSLTADWSVLFPDIMAIGGFDCVIGNPPYGAKLDKNQQEILKKLYITASGKLDTYGLFIERGIELLNNNGILGFIVPYTWLSIKQYTKLRKYLLNKDLFHIVYLPTKIFEDADLDTTLLFVKNSQIQNKRINIGILKEDKIIFDKDIEIKNIIKDKELIINLTLSKIDMNILKKVQQNAVELSSLFRVSQGYIPYRRSDLIKKYGNDQGNRIVDERLWHSDKQLTNDFKQEVQGRDISRYGYKESFQYIKYGKHLACYVPTEFFSSPRIVIMEVTRGDYYKIKATYLEKELYNTPSIINIIDQKDNKNNLKFILSLINSKFYTWYHLKLHSKANAKTSIPKILVKDVKSLPIPNILKEQQEPFINLVNIIMDSNEKIVKYNKHFDSLNAVDKIEIKEEIEKLESLVKDSIDEIDRLVYGLYGLSGDEIKIVEGKK